MIASPNPFDESASSPPNGAELRFRTLFAQAPFSVQILAADGTTLEVNRAWEQLWLSSEDENLRDYILSGHYNILDDPQLQEKGVTPFLRRAFSGESVSIPAIYYDPKELGRPGSPRWVTAQAHPILGADGSVEQVMLIHTDVSQQHFLELEQQKAEKALRESEALLRQIANFIPQMVWMADSDGAVRWYNDRWYAYTGTTFEQIRDWGWSIVHDPDVLPEVVEKWKHSLRTGESFQMTVPIRGADGNFRPFYSLVYPLRDDSGKVIRWFGTNTDVSELQEAERALRHAMAELQAVDRRKDEFLAMLAHELRNPLAPIATAADLLNVMPGDENNVRHAGNVIARQVDHMTRLIDDLMDVSRVTRGKITLSMEPLDLKRLVESSVEQVHPLIEARRLVLSIRMDGGPLTVLGDRTRLTQAVANLLNNAAKFTRDGGSLEVSVSSSADGTVSIGVRDSGIGIEPEFLPHVFKMFTQGDRGPERSASGLGIGLALVEKIVELHGGSVTAESAGRGQGSCFTVKLPLLARDELEAAEASRTVQADSCAGLHVMIVDDNRDAGQTLAQLCRVLGHHVSFHESASQALSCAEIASVELFILDIGLSDTTGYELIRQLQAKPVRADAVFVALTGYGQENDRKRALEAGFHHHIVKPITMTSLLALLAQVCRPAAP